MIQNIPSVSFSMAHADLIVMCKVFNNLSPGLKQEDFFKKAIITSVGEHHLKPNKQFSRLDFWGSPSARE